MSLNSEHLQFENETGETAMSTECEPLPPESAPAPVTEAVIRRHISTRERRYFFQDVRELLAFLRARGAPLQYVPGREASDVTTVYLDTFEGTWSEGRSRNKLRCKNYDNPGEFWFEVKRRQGLKVDKRRQHITPDALPDVLAGVRRGPGLQRLVRHAPLVPLVAVKYRRIAFEWPGVRVTIDRNLRFHAVGSGTPWTVGRCIGRKVGFVVEVKCEGQVPGWLAPQFGGRRPQRFSKSKWSLLSRSQPWAL